MKPRRARGALVVPGEVVAIRSFMRTRLLPERHASNSVFRRFRAG